MWHVSPPVSHLEKVSQVENCWRRKPLASVSRSPISCLGLRQYHIVGDMAMIYVGTQMYQQEMLRWYNGSDCRYFNFMNTNWQLYSYMWILIHRIICHHWQWPWILVIQIKIKNPAQNIASAITSLMKNILWTLKWDVNTWHPFTEFHHIPPLSEV